MAHDVEAQLSTGVTPALGAGHPSIACIAQVYLGGTRGFAQDLGGEGDRSTATGASTNGRGGDHSEVSAENDERVDERVMDLNSQVAFSSGQGRRHERVVHVDLNLDLF